MFSSNSRWNKYLLVASSILVWLFFTSLFIPPPPKATAAPAYHYRIYRTSEPQQIVVVDDVVTNNGETETVTLPPSKLPHVMFVKQDRNRTTTTTTTSTESNPVKRRRMSAVVGEMDPRTINRIVDANNRVSYAMKQPHKTVAVWRNGQLVYRNVVNDVKSKEKHTSWIYPENVPGSEDKENEASEDVQEGVMQNIFAPLEDKIIKGENYGQVQYHPRDIPYDYDYHYVSPEGANEERLNQNYYYNYEQYGYQMPTTTQEPLDLSKYKKIYPLHKDPIPENYIKTLP